MNKKLLLKGMGVSEGLARGAARIILPGEALPSFKEGEILVSTLTDPTMVAAMVKAGAIVTDGGGMTSHPAILSREMGIPCVVNTGTGTTIIKQGMNIEVDGASGEIYEVE